MKEKSNNAGLVTDLTLILDRSGSMQATASDTRGSVNKFISDQAKVKGECRLSIVQFNTSVENTCTEVNIDRAPKLNERNYDPAGNTALLDAIGITIEEKRKRYANLKREHKPKFIVCIVTDGLENSSRRYSNSQIKEMIEKRESKGWTFIYLGANQDAFAAAGGIGIRATSVANYAASPIGTSSMFSNVGSNLAGYREKISRGWARGQSVTDSSLKHAFTATEVDEIQKHIKAKK